MTQTFTHSDVLRYVYEETTNEENSLIEEALVADATLLMHYLDTIEMKHLMNKIDRTPCERSVENILAYSRSYQPNLTFFA
jgi:peptidyl-tRNA hydrolase